MKKLWWIVGLLVLGAALWGVQESKSDAVVGGLIIASDTADTTIEFVTYVSNFSVTPVTQDITVDLLLGRGGFVSDIPVQAGDILTMDGLEILSITIDRTNATEVDLYWWY